MNILKNFLATASLVTLASCQPAGPQDFVLEKDQCDNCKMTITNAKYGAEMITEKGRVYKFDDISCMTMFANSEAEKAANATKYVVDFPSGKFLELSKAHLISGGSISSPMGGNTQAYETPEAAKKAAESLGAQIVN